MSFIDTHCHIHSVDYPVPMDEVEAHCLESGVETLICVGENAADSERAVAFVQDRPDYWASVGQHPHEAKDGVEPLERLRTLLKGGSINDGAMAESRSRIIAIGECGLDYFYGHSSKKDQEKTLRYQIELALEYQLPVIFHVREAFTDFWPVFDSYSNIRGVLHSFTDDSTNLSKAISRGLYVGVNGIMTFTKNSSQLEVARQIPDDRLLLETDSPFLTPAPLRGKVNEPARVLLVAEFLARLRGQSLQNIADYTAANARQLFSI